MNLHRCFLAVKLPIINIQSIHTELNKFGTKIKFVDSNLLHITTHFFGNITDNEINSIKNNFQTMKFKPFTINLMGVGKLPPIKKTKILYIKINCENNELIDLVREIRSRVKYIGLNTDRRDFLPHLTIARLKDNYNSQSLIDKWYEYRYTSFGSFTIDKLELIKSTLLHTGPIYETLASYPN